MSVVLSYLKSLFLCNQGEGIVTYLQLLTRIALEVARGSVIFWTIGGGLRVLK